MMTMTPSLVRRLPASRIRRTATSLGNDGERRASKRSCTAEETLLTFWPPGPDERTKLSESSDSSIEMASVMRSIVRSRTGQVFLRQYLALFHRRLIEGIDAEQMRGNDGFQHEMHQQFAEACFVELRKLDRAHGAAVFGERIGGGARLRRGEIADGLSAKPRLAGEHRKVLVDAGPKAGAGDADHGEQLVARAGEIKLHLAVLIDRAERADRRRALAVFPQAFRPELDVPMRKAFEAVGIGHDHADRLGLALGERHRERGAERRRHLGRFLFRQYRGKRRGRASADGGDVEAEYRCRQQTDIGQRRIAAADARIVVEHRRLEFAEQIAQAVALAGLVRLGDAEEYLAG